MGGGKQNEKGLISVIVPVYNSESYVERALKSIQNNNYKNLEIIVVDDGSSDSSLALCNALAEKDSRIKVYAQQNAGTAVARNNGIKMAQGEFIAFADNDDFLHPDFYQVMLNSILETNADIVMCDLTRDMDEIVFYSAEYIDAEARLIDKSNLIESTYRDCWTRNTVPWNKLYKATLFDDIRFPEGKGYEDAYTTYRLIFKAKSIAYVDAAMYYWWYNQDSYSSKKSNPAKLFYREEALRQQTLFYKKNAGEEYQQVTRQAQYFYLSQLFAMYYQLQNDYEQNQETLTCIKQMKKIYRRYLLTHLSLCTGKQEKIHYLELAYPILGGQLRKYFLRGN